MKVREFLRLTLCALAAGCTRSQPPIPQAWRGERLLFVGNSITRHPPADWLDWKGDWGMAASAPENDYVHLVVSGVEKRTGRRPEFATVHAGDFEREWSRNRVVPIASDPDTVIVAIGENVPPFTPGDEAAFRGAMERLLREMKGSGRALFVRSSFYPNRAVDAAMREACTAVGGAWVDIRGLSSDPRNAARSEREFQNGAVAGHPGDRGMKAIADAILSVMDASSR